MTALPPDEVARREFLLHHTPGGPWLLTTIAPDGPIKTCNFTRLEGACRFIANQEAAGKNNYYSINPTKTKLTKKAGKTDIAQVRFLHADLDPADNETPEDFKARLLATVAAFPQPPTFVVDSGNGLQLLWRLQQPVQVTGPEVIADIEARNYALALAFGADPSTRDISRIFRMPGTTNFPNTKKRRIGRVECEAKLLKYSDASYPLDAFPPHHMEKEAPSRQQRRRQQQQAHGQQTSNGHQLDAVIRHACFERFATRSEAVWFVTNEMVRRGYSDAAIVRVLLEPSNAISEHILDHSKPEEYAARQVERARQELAAEQATKATAAGPAAAAPEPPPRRTRKEVHAAFRKWFGPAFDLAACDVVCAVAAAERLSGDPLGLMIIGAPGVAKTETVGALKGAGAEVISTIASEGALLSATKPRGKQHIAAATGGLLRKIGERGVLVIKDFTSIISMHRDTRTTVLAALREIFDGLWVRNVGSEGGQTLEWHGRIVVIAAVTTVWDSHHAVIAAMGDRFVSLRIDSSRGRRDAGMQALCNTGQEKQMRAELAAAMGGLVCNADTAEVELKEEEMEQLLKAADIVTNARTAVERDNHGNIIDRHAAEMPTRFAKQLAQMLRGAVAIGMSRKEAMRLAIRCARDSIPPLRLEILLDVASHERSRPADVRKRLKKPWTTTRRELEALQMLGLLDCEEEEKKAAVAADDDDGKTWTVWRYSIAASFDIETLQAMAGQQPEAGSWAPPRRGDDGAARPTSPEKSDQGEIKGDNREGLWPRRAAHPSLGDGHAAPDPDFSGDGEC
jgi:hypothetical protein